MNVETGPYAEFYGYHVLPTLHVFVALRYDHTRPWVLWLDSDYDTATC